MTIREQRLMNVIAAPIGIVERLIVLLTWCHIHPDWEIRFYFWFTRRKRKQEQE